MTGYLTIGDTVRLKSRLPGPHGDGFQGQDLIVVGFKHQVVGRITHGYRALKKPPRPGIYLDPNYVAVATRTGICMEGFHWQGNVRLADSKVAKQRSPRPQHMEPVFLRDLPDTPFWEGDLVTWSPTARRSGERRFVTGIDHFGCTSNGDVLPEYVPAYLLGHTLLPDSFDSHRINDLKPAKQLSLIERGNVWRHYHGEKLEFESLHDEALFAILMGWFVPIGPTLQSADEAIRVVGWGNAHGYFTRGDKNSPWGAQPFQFSDEEFGKRYRHKLLHGLEPINIP